MEAVIVGARKKRPYYGPLKLHHWLQTWYDEEQLPAVSTIGVILKRNGLTRPRRKRRRAPPFSQPFSKCEQANAVWCVDFKGHFHTGDGDRCYPLTIMDAHTRFLLRCEVLTSTSVRDSREVFKSAFAEFGLPEAIRSDNGSPFASKGAGGLTQLSASSPIQPGTATPGSRSANTGVAI